ncbi:MAG: site-2 protease family protein [Ruminococcaceae bacterium]|nr:site-2 protease family protein [Oscillospiraceae bacterium]
MLLSMLTGGGSPRDILISLLLSLPIVLLALSIHETAHGYVAWKCGDPTAHNLGRLTLNPAKHLDPMGTLCMLLVGFGWAKPVPINSRYFRKPKRDMALTAMAGPCANLLLGLIFTLLLGFLSSLYVFLAMKFARLDTVGITMTYWGYQICFMGAYLNFFLMAFNLLPIPPFDGSRFALTFLPTKYYFGLMKYERQIMLGTLLALLVLSNMFDFSPFGWIADKLIELVATPIQDLSLKFIFLPLLGK